MIYLISIYALYATFKWFLYYCGMRGLLYQMIKKFKYNPTDEEIKKLRDMAIKQTIKEVFKN
ncbi:MAG: hypothetical protein ACK5L6_13375 [Anaerorhabdus sp.]|uniref:hypothetical protein n=1 Tax=Anaerorhabdus sp. TaxID=1872524 RepID=UPI003A84951D